MLIAMPEPQWRSLRHLGTTVLANVAESEEGQEALVAIRAKTFGPELRKVALVLDHPELILSEAAALGLDASAHGQLALVMALCTREEIPRRVWERVVAVAAELHNRHAGPGRRADFADPVRAVVATALRWRGPSGPDSEWAALWDPLSSALAGVLARDISDYLKKREDASWALPSGLVGGSSKVLNVAAEAVSPMISQGRCSCGLHKFYRPGHVVTARFGKRASRPHRVCLGMASAPEPEQIDPDDPLGPYRAPGDTDVREALARRLPGLRSALDATSPARDATELERRWTCHVGWRRVVEALASRDDDELEALDVGMDVFKTVLRTRLLGTPGSRCGTPCCVEDHVITFWAPEEMTLKMWLRRVAVGDKGRSGGMRYSALGAAVQAEGYRFTNILAKRCQNKGCRDWAADSASNCPNPKCRDHVLRWEARQHWLVAPDAPAEKSWVDHHGKRWMAVLGLRGPGPGESPPGGDREEGTREELSRLGDPEADTEAAALELVARAGTDSEPAEHLDRDAIVNSLAGQVRSGSLNLVAREHQQRFRQVADKIGLHPKHLYDLIAARGGESDHPHGGAGIPEE